MQVSRTGIKSNFGHIVKFVLEFLVLDCYRMTQTKRILSIKLCPCDKMVNWPGPEVIKLFSCSTQLSMKFKIPIGMKVSRNSAFFRRR